MAEALMVVGVLTLFVIGGVFIVVGILELFGPWDTREKVLGGIKLVVGIALLLATTSFMVVLAKDQAQFEMKCFSRGWVPSRLCLL